MAVTTINIDSQVLTFANLATFPITGTVKTIYIAEDTNYQYYWDGSQYVLLGSVGTVTSVGLTMPSAFTVANSPITSSGDIAVTGAGLANQYVRGDGSLANFPTNGGGGSAVNYYLNGSVNQGTFGGDTYYELSKTPIIGAGTNFTRTNAQGNGYIASFITDAGDPNLLNIPGGNWALEFYFNANSGGGSPSFYGELYKVSNTNVFTLIASGSTSPEGITQGTTIDQYFTSIPVPQTTLLATDRLAIRVYVITGGRNITLHTEDNNLCQVITTFSTGLNALNGLTAQVQNFAVGTSGTDFAINSVTDTHTFNLPTASALNRGALSSADWSTFNNKVSTGVITGSGLTMATDRLLGRSTAGSGAVEEITIGSGLTLSGGTLTAAGGSGITIGTTAIASGTVNRILFQGAGDVVQQDSTFVWNNTDKRLILGTEASADANTRLVIIGTQPASSTTTFGLKVHNSTGTNNALVVRDDGFVGIGTNIPNSKFNVHSLTSISNQTLSNSTNSALLQLQTLGGGGYTGNTLLLQSPHGLTFESNGNNGQGYSHSFYSGNSVRAFMVLATTPRTRFVINDTNGGSSYSQYEINQGSSITWIRTVASTGGSNPIIFGRGSGAGTEYSRFTNEGNLLLGTTSQGASATKTLVINNGIAPSGNVTASFQQYSADITAGNAAPHFRTENGDIVKIYSVGGWGLPTGAFTRTTFDTTTVTLEQLAERVAALIQDLRDNHKLLKA